MTNNVEVLILGASYGSLLASKLALAGHNVQLVCLPAEANLINKAGIEIRMPVRGRDELVVVQSKQLTGEVSASAPDLVPFEKYANAAKGLLKPSSAARAFEAGATHIERVATGWLPVSLASTAWWIRQSTAVSKPSSSICLKIVHPLQASSHFSCNYRRG